MHQAVVHQVVMDQVVVHQAAMDHVVRGDVLVDCDGRTMRAGASRAMLFHFAVFFGLVISMSGCKEREQAPPREIEAVRMSTADRRAIEAKLSSFCDVSYPSEGDDARRFVAPADRPLPGGASGHTGEDTATSWRWVNFWASWCGPCLREMPILKTWRASLKKEGVAVDFEFWSVDEAEADLAPLLSDRGRFPGVVHWMRNPERIGDYFSSLGIDEHAPIPVHVLVDARSNIRCVRIGEVREALYGTVRTILMASSG